MAWKWYEITEYKVSVGGGNYYGGVQLFGDGFYGLLSFRPDGTPLPSASDPTTFGQRFYGYLHFSQHAAIVDLLRNEKPVRFGWYDENPNLFHMMTGAEPTGEQEEALNQAANASP